jgi:hypothetical protein
MNAPMRWQMVEESRRSLTGLAEGHSFALYVPGSLTTQHLSIGSPRKVFHSKNNPGAMAVALELLDAYPGTFVLTTELGTARDGTIKRRKSTLHPGAALHGHPRYTTSGARVQLRKSICNHSDEGNSPASKPEHQSALVDGKPDMVSTSQFERIHAP